MKKLTLLATLLSAFTFASNTNGEKKKRQKKTMKQEAIQLIVLHLLSP